MVRAEKIDNKLRKMVLDVVAPTANVRDKNDISYGNISDRIISASVDQWIKALGIKESTELDEKSAAWQRKAGKNSEGGLNAAGRKSYERENPGSDLKAPVSAKTASKNPDGKAAGRRKSFCARMGGMPGPMKDEKGRPTRKALALRKWDC